MAPQQITDFGYEVVLVPKSSTAAITASLFTGIMVHNPADDVSDQIKRFCDQRGLNVSNYEVRRDLTIF